MIISFVLMSMFDQAVGLSGESWSLNVSLSKPYMYICIRQLKVHMRVRKPYLMYSSTGLTFVPAEIYNNFL